MLYSEKSMAWIAPETRKSLSESGKTYIEYNADFYGWAVKAQAVCPDGRIRKVRLGCAGDSYWTIPARLSIRNTTLTGHVAFQGGEWNFVAEKW
jgi:hypothetical protein